MEQRYYHMTIAGLERDLPICPLNDELMIAGFVIFGDPELTTACSKALLDRAPTYDYMISAEAKGIPLVHEMARLAGNQKYFANIFYGFRPSVVKDNKMLYLTVAAVAAFNISIQVFMPYLIIYYEKTLAMTDYVLIFAPAIILAAVFTGLYGQVYDKKGFRTAIVLPMVLLMAGYVILYLTRHTVPVFIGSVLMMCGFLGTGAILGAKVRTHTPENRSGMFQGLRIVGQVLIPGVVGPYIGKMILQNAQMITNSDGTQSFLPNANIFLGALVAIAFAWVVMIPLMKKEK